MMSFEKIKELIQLVNQSEMMYVDIKTDDMHITLSKREQADLVHAPLSHNQTQTDSKQEISVVTNDETIPTQAISQGNIIESPLVGVAYLSPAPDLSPFKQVGDTVAVGDVLCIVEAMKIMNEIKSDVAGVVTEIMVDNQQIVEFGQPLFRIL
ncbi:acetyl-CoA carboxylase biotin carboxyl carrier protein [Granulicatella sp. zg-ZJ]|uniref:acetyl-CoA carboxylase biotin carboxyl carrier protein n=1 Tax=Granulicatella sp. zg-ZJ TaxID=2678504 RepID=UPI0013D23C1D|nr:acetyl-CoA carboxylase biotin carboxyl carrier protein [Granulicatella sp. zg-ZJ]NEW62193.1 acetyl-CoA carboxylase biotin carboxyl carrier protein [Granulicatella sp. zg-ZJ]